MHRASEEGIAMSEIEDGVAKLQDGITKNSCRSGEDKRRLHEFIVRQRTTCACSNSLLVFFSSYCNILQTNSDRGAVHVQWWKR
jgi:hypothetical protein